MKHDTNLLYLDSFAIEIYLGAKRSGKTLSMIAKTFNDLQKVNFEVEIFSNIHLNTKYFPKFTLINKDDIIKFYEDRTILQNSIFLLDELHTICDSRNFMGKSNKAFGYFVGQIGKRKNILRGTTHFPSLIDFRIRQYTEKIIKVDKGFMDTNNNYRQLKNFNTPLTKEENDNLLIRNMVYLNRIDGFNNSLEFEEEFFIKAKDHFDKYKTDEIVV